MHDDPALSHTRCVLVTQATSLSNVDAALSRGAVHGMLTRPWSRFGLRDQLRAQLSTYHVEHDPDGLDTYGDLIQTGDRARAQHRIDQRRARPGPCRRRPSTRPARATTRPLGSRHEARRCARPDARPPAAASSQPRLRPHRAGERCRWHLRDPRRRGSSSDATPTPRQDGPPGGHRARSSACSRWPLSSGRFSRCEQSPRCAHFRSP